VKFHINYLEHVHIYIKKEIVENFSFDSIIDGLKDLKEPKTIFLYMCDFFYSYNYTKLLNYVLTSIELMTIIKYINFEYIILALPKLLFKIRHCFSHSHRVKVILNDQNL